jgi:hypothetical protein
MSVAVALEELGRQIEDFGHDPVLVSVGEDARAHVVSIVAPFDGHRFTLEAGRTTRANVAVHPAVTLLWTSATGAYDLIVDGDAHPGDDRIVVEPTRAVLHRHASAPDDISRCVPLEQTD